MKAFLHPFARMVVAAMVLVMLVSCTGNRKRVSPPAAAVQQLTVQANGDWALDLRLHNYSSVSMRFDSVALELSVDEHVAGTLRAAPGISIGPTSADVVKVSLKPDGMARIVMADALAGRRTLSYRLEGTVNATPDESSKSREFEVDDRSSLNPAPGLDGVMR